MIKVNRKESPKVTKEELMSEVQEGINPSHLFASLEYATDLMLDMLFLTVDAQVTSGDLALTEEQKVTYEALKTAQSETKSFDLQNSSFPDGLSVIDYMFGFKKKIQANREEYFKKKSKLGE